MGLKGWEVSLFLVGWTFNKYYYCNIRLQFSPELQKTLLIFLSYKTLKKKKKDFPLKIFCAFSCKWKHLLKSSSMKSSHISKKKKFFCTLVPIIMLKLMGNLKKKATVRQRKLNTVHLLRTSSTIKIHCFPSSDHRSRFSLEFAVVKKLRQAQLVWLRGLRWY